MGCEAAEEARQVNPGLGHESRQFLDKLKTREEEMARTVGILGLEPQNDVAAGQELEAVFGYCRAGDVAAKFLEFLPFPGRAVDCRVERKSRGRRTEWAFEFGLQVTELQRAQPPHSLSAALTHRDSRLHARGLEFG